MILLLLAGRMAAQVPVLDSVCPGAVAHYRVDGEPGSTYSWILTTPGGDEELLPSDADTLQMFWNYDAGDYKLHVIQHSIDGCDADAVYGLVVVREPPFVYAGADQTIPHGTSTTIGDAFISGTEPLEWYWEPAELLIDPTALHPTTVNLTISTTFRLFVKDAIGCENMDEMTIFVEGGALAVLPEAVPEEICLGGMAQLFANASGGSGVYTYSWTSDPPGFVSTDANPSVSPSVTTTYSVEVDDGYNTETGSVTVTVHPLPDVYAGADQAIMGGTSTTIGDATAFGQLPLTYSWTPADLLLDPTVLHPTTVDLFVTTIFTLTVTDANGCQNSDQVVILIIDESLAVDPTVVPEAICPGGWAQLFANASGGSGMYTYLWTSDPPGLVSPEANPIVAPPETTIYTVVVDDGFTQVTGTVTLTVYDPPQVYAGADQTIPYGTATTINDATASGAEPLIYSWEPADMLLDPTVLNPTTVTLLAAVTYTLTVTDANGCHNSDQMTVFVDGVALAVNPTAEPDEICLGETVQLFANATGGTGSYTYSWTSDPVGFTSTEENPIVSPSETTTYLLEVSDGITTETGLVIVTVHPLPEVYAGADQTILYGTSTTIGDAWASGTMPLTYNWEPAAWLVDPNVLNPVTFVLFETTTFTLTVTDANDCQASDTMTVFIEGGPLEADPFAVPDEICLGDTVQLFANASSGSGSYTYSWVSDPVGFVSDEENPMVSPSETTTYLLEVSDGISTVTGSVIVTVHPLPEVYAGADQTIPYGTATTIGDATASGAGPLVYSWSPAGLLADATVLHPVTLDLETTTSFILTVTDANGCQASDTMTVFITGGPLAVEPFAVPDAICLGETVQLFANASGGSESYTYLWVSDPIGFTSVEENPVVSPAVTTMYTVTVDDGIGTVSGTVTVTVHPLPEVYAGADQSIIYNTSTTIGDATASGAEPLTFSWEPADLLLDPTVLHPTTIDLESTTTFILTVTDANGCQNSDEVTIEVRLVTMLQAIAGPGEHCVGNSITIPMDVYNFNSVATFQLKLEYNDDFLECTGYTNVHPLVADNLEGWIDHVNSEITFQWHSDIPLTFTQLTTIVDLVFLLKQAGLGTLDWYTGDTESYFADPEGELIPAEFLSGEIMIYEPPVIYLSETMPVCVGEPVTITGIAYGTNPPLSYQWTYPTGYTTSEDPQFDSITMNYAGVYTLLVTDAMGCTDQQTITLQVFENPVALFHGQDTIVVDPGYILEAGEGHASYLWNTGEKNDYIVIDTAGMYWVEMISGAGCYGIDSIYMKLVPPQCMFIPNAFTPNGDGLNDVFQAISACPVTYYKMYIYNRWGEKLFESNDISIGWDGTKNGVPCPGDAYVYLITYRVLENLGVEAQHTAAGILVLLR